ncbi:MAG: putative Ig domain-containing protein [Brotaphodocola sp.]
MKAMKQKLAVLLTVLLMMPTQALPVIASAPANITEKLAVQDQNIDADAGTKSNADVGTGSNAQKGTDEDEDTFSEEFLENDLEWLDEFDEATPDDADLLQDDAAEEIRFNTGNQEFCIVSQEDFIEQEIGDAYFEEDGSYTIQIPEVNPFFPYEVQFKQNGKVRNEWFMTPDDSVEVGGHEFFVSAYFDETAVTQMSLNIAGDIVTVYPKEKTFTNEGGISFFSLLELEERYLEIDLSGYTPAELTMVSVDTIFTGNEELKEKDQVIWAVDGEDDYRINASGDILDLSYETGYGGTVWEMIVGENDQLASTNIRYFIDVMTTESETWLVPEVYSQSEEGVRTPVTVLESAYADDWRDKFRELNIDVPRDEIGSGSIYLSLSVNEELYPEILYDHMKVFEGSFEMGTASASNIEFGTDITSQILGADMTAKDGGYLFDPDSDAMLTFVTYDSRDQITGCLTVCVYMDAYRNSLSYTLYLDTENGRTIADDSHRRVKNEDGSHTVTCTLYNGYAADEIYHLVMGYYTYGYSDPDAVTAAYVGNYTSIAEADKKGAKNIQEELFDRSGTGGYAADYSDGVWITVFVGADDSDSQEVYRYQFKTQEGSEEPSIYMNLYFYDLKDADGNWISCEFVDDEQDSYAEYNYLTVLVNEEADLTSLAPCFSVSSSAVLYAEGSSTPEVSGKSLHDFSDGPVQYTLSAKNGRQAKNYWLHVVQAAEGAGPLYINSLSDENAETTTEDGVIYSTREMFLDGRYDYVHDILLINTGKEPLEALSVELVSDQVQLDDYWKLNGNYELSGFSGINKLNNMAKLRLKAKDGVIGGSEISGTLTVKASGEPLMVLTLTGVVGDPSIVTTNIPQAVKYVPYGTMIQNSNKYDWNVPTYRLVSGKLPGGMTVQPNGEIYGVPTETGTFTFTVRMQSSEYDFEESEMTYTLVVMENTDANVDAATDPGYELTQRVPNITVYDSADHLMVSEGIYDEFEDVFLDGVKLKEGVDYTSESGSTRITIRSQTLRGSGKAGVHTLGVEFRTGEERVLKRAAQNYRVTGTSTGNTSSRDDDSSSKTSSDDNSGITKDARKGYMSAEAGVITGNGIGYAQWIQDEHGWKLMYADGTMAAGYMFTPEDGTSKEQILWEKVNSRWYAFGADGYLKSGWINDYQLGSWYWVSIDYGMKSGWYTDPQDGFTYYLDPETGKIVAGWKRIDEKWYYFNEIAQKPTWVFDEQKCVWYYDILSKNKPYGSMYWNERTPDGYLVGVDGAWME